MTLHYAAAKAFLVATILLSCSSSTCAAFSMFPSRQLRVRTLAHSNAQAWSALRINLSDDEVYDDTALYSYEDAAVSDYYDEEEGSEKKKQKKWIKPVLAAPVVLAALFRLTSGCSLATRVTVSGAFIASIVWRRRRRKEDENQEEYNMEVLHEEKTVQENRWVNTRLSEAQQREQAEDETRRAAIAKQRAAQMETARHWAASTLEHTTQLQQEVEERRKQEALAREQAANWLESTSTLAGIDLHGGGMGSEEDDDGIENWNQDPPDRATMWLESTSNLAGIDLTGGGDAEERIDDRMEEDQYY